ncbi:MAG: branched-chain amino acid ABC transporter substrate-binding protein, partial [Desulfamplus sp.]|nr:branched-chain amino acid ABC transporter substrate-binding protein [Desulfamplus sp.]
MHKPLPYIVCIAISILLLSLIFSGCDKPDITSECVDNIGCIDLKQGEPLKIGVLQSLSGNVAPLGLEQIRGLELAMDKWGSHILDHPILLQIEDTECTAEGGANAVLKVIADPKTVAIFGTTCSGAAASVSKAMSNAGLTMISGNNSAPFLTSIGGKAAPYWYPGYFRTASNEEHSGKAAALFAWHELKVRKVATINDGDIYTRGLTDGFIKSFQELGGEIVLNGSINKGDTNMEPILQTVKLSGAQLMFFPLFQPEGNHLLLQVRKTSGMENIILMSDGALIEDSFIRNVKDAAKGMYFVGPSPPRGIESRDLAVAYEAKYDESPSTSYYITAFDAANLLFKAIEKASVMDSSHGKLRIGRQALRDALYNTKGVEGVSGRLSCDKFGDCAFPAFNVLRLDNP